VGVDSGADGQAKKKRRSSSGCDPDAKQEELPLHVIRRTLPLKTRSSDPAQCVDIVDRMYNVYYELEVNACEFVGALKVHRSHTRHLCARRAPIRRNFAPSRT